MTATFISLGHPVLAVFWWRPNLRCLHFLDEGPSRKVPAPFTPLFLIISEPISLIFMLEMTKCHEHQYFYQDTISKKTVSQDWRTIQLPIRHDHFLLDANPAFICLKDDYYYYYYYYCYHYHHHNFYFPVLKDLRNYDSWLHASFYKQRFFHLSLSVA